ncbi:MAG: hypothetical protein WAU98_00675 [Candidatus Nanopelagicaceae bacterium]
MKKFIALTLAALAVVTMTSAPANAKGNPNTTTFSATTIPGANWCC